jgi:hypothetical protein
MILAGVNRIVWTKPVQVPLFFTKNLTFIDLGLNPAFRAERPRTNCLRHGTALTTNTNLIVPKDPVRTVQ